LTPTVDQAGTGWNVRLDGDLTLASAAALKTLLLEWRASGKDLELDLENASDIDITTMQLLWAAAREAGRAGVRLVTRRSKALEMAWREAGFDPDPAAAGPE
jgi:anti-anti-sigma regulatory factor